MIEWDIITNEKTVVANVDNLYGKHGSEIEISPDGSYALLVYMNNTSQPPHLTFWYYVTDLLLNDSGHYITAPNGDSKLQSCQWWHDSNSSNHLVYTYQNNIYFRPGHKLNSSDDDIAITDDGQLDHIINGNVMFWVLEDKTKPSAEIYPNWYGPMLAYAQFNVSQVPRVSMAQYGTLGQSPKAESPKIRFKTITISNFG